MSAPTLHPRHAVVLIPVILACLTMLGPFSIDTPFPAFKEMGRDFEVDGSQMQYVVSAYLMSFGLMSPFHGPLSDALGRKPVIVGGVLVYVAASIGCALSPNLPVLLGFRVLQGLSAGGGVIVGRTVIRDVFEGAEAQRLMSRVMMIFGVAPAIAPVIGGLLLQAGPWPVLFWFMAGFGLLLTAFVLLTLPETHPPERRLEFKFSVLLGSLVDVSSHLAYQRVAWAAALSFAGQFLYIGAAPIFVVDLLGKGELDFWVFFVPMIVGITLGAWISSRAAGVITGRTLVTWSMGFAVGAAAVNAVLAGLPTAADLPYAVIGPSLIAIGTAAAYPTLQLVLLDMFPRQRGAAVSMFTFIALLLNGVIASAVAPHVTSTVLTMALASTVLVVAGFVLWLWHLSISDRPAPVTPHPVETAPRQQR